MVSVYIFYGPSPMLSDMTSFVTPGFNPVGDEQDYPKVP
jgi:hypothetical protein